MRQFGNREQVESEVAANVRAGHRDARRADLWDAFRQDVRYALRQLRLSPQFALIATATLALGIGATVSIFSVVNGVLLRPLPYDGADRIVVIAESQDAGSRDASGTTSYVLFEDLQKQAKSLEAVAVFDGWSPAITGSGDAQRLAGSFVTSGIFDVFRIHPVLGRPMLPEDNVESAPRRVWISWKMWQTRFGGAPDVIGKHILLNANSMEITGVLPRDFTPPGEEMSTDVWSNNYRDAGDSRDSRYLNVVARIRPGVTLDQTRAELRTLSLRLQKDFPKDNAGEWTLAFPIRDLVVGGRTRGPILLLMLSSALVLLIACANISNLLLARGAQRARELSVRIALGTTRTRLIRQLVTESVVLAAAGTLMAMPIAWIAVRTLVQLSPPAIRSQPIGMNAPVLAFSIVAALLSALLFGVLPALRSTRTDVQSTLREEGRTSTSMRARRMRSTLAVVQLALALALVSSAGLLIKSFRNVMAVDPGIRTENLFVASLNLPASRYKGEAMPRFFDELIAKVEAIPGVTEAAITSVVPLGGKWDRVTVDTGNVRDVTNPPQGDRFVVSDGYFSAMGIHLKEGRLFTREDRAGSPLSVIVDEVFAKKLRPGGRAIGARIHMPGNDSSATVIGIVGHVKSYGLDAESGGGLYVSQEQYPWRWMNIVARTTSDPLSITAAVREAVHSLDSDQPIFDVNTVGQFMADRTAVRRFVVALLSAYAAVALMMAAVGLYGVIAYGVTQRQREFGIRLALGATPARIIRMVMTESGALTLAGVLTGTVIAVAAGRLLAGLLFHVPALDPLIASTAAGTLALAAALATWIPARRAARADPLTSLRS
jgi:putative ABC transport system permease protein